MTRAGIAVGNHEHRRREISMLTLAKRTWVPLVVVVAVALGTEST
jgi:hypothetical protein